MSEERAVLKSMILEIDARKVELRAHKHELKVMSDDIKDLEEKFHMLALAEFTKEPTTGEKYDALMKQTVKFDILDPLADF